MTEIDNHYLDALSGATGIKVPKQNRDGVRVQLNRLAGMASLVMDFPVPESEEPITIMRHD